MCECSAPFVVDWSRKASVKRSDSKAALGPMDVWQLEALLNCFDSALSILFRGGSSEQSCSLLPRAGWPARFWELLLGSGSYEACDGFSSLDKMVLVDGVWP